MHGEPPRLKVAIRTKSVLPFLFFLFFLSSCTISQAPLSLARDIPRFIDDGHPDSLLSALHHQKEVLGNQDPTRLYVVSDMQFSGARLADSLDAFIAIMEMDLSTDQRDRIIKERFDIYQAAGRSQSTAGEMLVTGYYEPLFAGSLKKEAPFLYPLYAVPEDLISQRLRDGKTMVGRIAPEKGDTFTPYWTRAEIDGSDILQGYELVYLKNRFDAFLLHVQGSGKIQLNNGEIRSIRYRGNNGHPYSSIGKLLVDEKKLSLEETNIETIRSYLETAPEELDRVLNHNRRYIFFAWGDTDSPRGSSNAPLTPERSIAIDQNVLPMRTVAYLQTERPVMDSSGKISHWEPMRRFVVPQDTGAAIKGSGRVDLFWGSGDYAEKAAGAMKHRGKLYFLIKKDEGYQP